MNLAKEPGSHRIGNLLDASNAGVRADIEVIGRAIEFNLEADGVCLGGACKAPPQERFREA
jgi:hypothetical protein